MRVTLKDIAERVGVGKTTVSVGLFECHQISLARRREIQRVAKQMRYVPDPFLKRLVEYRCSDRAAKFRGMIAWREDDGIGYSVRDGLNFTKRGFGVRGAVGVSDRRNSTASHLKPSDFDWENIFGKIGPRWLHTGEIFTALSETTAALTVEAVKAAAYVYTCACLLFGAVAAGEAENLPDPISIANFQKIVSVSNGVTLSFHVEGIVRAIGPQRKMIALQDSSATILIELPTLDDAIRVGERVSVEGENCSLRQSRFYTQLGTAPVVDNDGRHQSTLRSGSVFLEAGFQPICLEWFNINNPSALNVEWQGPHVRRQKIPSSVLWRKPVGGLGQHEFEHGLDFAAYDVDDWYFLPDFKSCTSVENGVATNFDLSYSVRSENTALVFSGYIKTLKSGIYTFYVTSDDGSQLYVGEPKVSCQVIAPAGQSIQPENLKPSPNESGDQWGELEGTVVFSSYDQHKLKIELAANGIRVPVTIVDGMSLFSTNLLHQQIRVAGIFEFSREPEKKSFLGVVVPSSEQLKIIGFPNGNDRKSSTNNLLTTIAQIRQLNSAGAALGIPIKIQGVVIGTSPSRLVLCDSTGGISVHFNDLDNWIDLPQVGELLEITGEAIPGDFVPAILAHKMSRLGNALMPEPIRPTWDELMNGSLDCEYVEIQGVLTAASTNELTLLTRDGKILIDRTDSHPLPQLPHLSGDVPLVGSVVRLRGGLNYEWDSSARQIIRGRFKLINPLMSVESPALLNPFSLPTSRIKDLLWYDAQARGLQKIKVEGQIIFVRPGEYFAQDHNIGFRVFTSEPVAIQVGDLVEAVGFPKVSGSSPVLQEAKIRKLNHAPLPVPVRLSMGELLDLSHDSTLVQVEAILVNYTTRPDAQTLQLQAGQTHFEARLNLDSSQPMSLSIGSRLQLVGVYAAMSPDHLGARADSFELLLNNPAAVTVLQMPPWWTIRRALGVAAALGAALGLAVIWVTLLQRKVEVRTFQLQKEIEGRQQAERQRIMEQERTRVAQDLHDELGAGLTEVSLLGSLAGRPDVPEEERGRYLDQLTKSARSLVTGLDEIVWAINPHYDSIGSIATYFSFYAEEFLNLANITCRLQVAESLPKFSLEPQVRHDIFLAFKEALNNVVRHSSASEVTLTINMAENQLVISIADNGCGFDDGPPNPASDGLFGMRERLKRLGGVCEITSQPGRGTTIVFRLDITAAIAHADQ